MTGSTNSLSLYQGGLHVIDLVTGADRRIPAAVARQAAPEFELQVWRRLEQAATRALGCAEPHVLAWSPDGSRLAYVCAGHIYTMRPDGTGRRLLRDRNGDRVLADVVTERKRIAFSTKSEPVSRLPMARSTIYAVDLDGTHRKLVTRGGAAPDWSPDGTKIAYWASACTGLAQPGRANAAGDPERARRDAEREDPGGAAGSDRRTRVPPGHPTVPRLAVTSWNGLYVMNADGSHVRASQRNRPAFGDARPIWQRHP